MAREVSAGTNYLIYYVGSEVVNALKAEDKKISLQFKN